MLLLGNGLGHRAIVFFLCRRLLLLIFIDHIYRVSSDCCTNYARLKDRVWNKCLIVFELTLVSLRLCLPVSLLGSVKPILVCIEEALLVVHWLRVAVLLAQVAMNSNCYLRSLRRRLRCRIT